MISNGYADYGTESRIAKNGIAGRNGRKGRMRPEGNKDRSMSLIGRSLFDPIMSLQINPRPSSFNDFEAGLHGCFHFTSLFLKLRYNSRS